MKKILFICLAALMVLAVSCRKNTDGGSKTGSSSEETSETMKTTSATTLSATDVSIYSACIHAKVYIADNDWTSFDYGFYMGTSEEALDTYILADELFDAEDAYLAELTGLEADTQYWYKAYIEIDGTPYSGETMSFKTGSNTIVVDGVSKSIVKASINKNNLTSNHYNILLFLDEAPSEWVQLQFDGDVHLGKTIDLTKESDPQDEGWYWYLAFHNTESIVFSANQAFFRCESGTLYTNRLEDENGSPVLEIAVKDCKIGDHTLALYFKGSLVDS